MPDDPTKRGPQDLGRINRSEEHEVRYWTQKFGVTNEQLADAVRAIGSSADRVERHLRGEG